MFGGAMMPANCAILQITKTNKNPSATRAPHRPIMTTLCLVAVAVACCYKVLPPNQLLSVLSFSYYFRSSHIFITARDLLNINIFGPVTPENLFQILLHSRPGQMEAEVLDV